MNPAITGNSVPAGRLQRSPEGARWQTALLFLCAALYLYLNFFTLRGTPFLLSGDQVCFWNYAQRMMAGQHIYRDFLEFTPPGTDLLYLGMFKLFGASLWVTNVTVLTLGAGLCSLGFSIAARIMKRNAATLAAALLVIVYVKSHSGVHHWLSALAIMGAIRICMPAFTPARTCIAGTFLALASFFTQTHGIVALIVFVPLIAAMQWKEETKGTILRNEALLLLGYAAALSMLSAPFIASVGFARVWYFQVPYVWQYVIYATPPGIFGLPEPLTLHSLPRMLPYLAVCVLGPVAYLATIWQCWRERRNRALHLGPVMLLCGVGALLLMAVFISSNWLRIYGISFAAIILLFWNLERLALLRRPTIIVLWMILAAIAVLKVRTAHVQQRYVVHLPAGDVAADSHSSEKLRWLAAHTIPGESLFQADWPGVYFPLKLHSPAFADPIVPGDGNRPEDIVSTLQRLEATQTHYIIWSPRLDATCPAPDGVTPVRTYLHSHYRQVQTFPNGETVWERKAASIP